MPRGLRADDCVCDSASRAADLRLTATYRHIATNAILEVSRITTRAALHSVPTQRLFPLEIRSRRCFKDTSSRRRRRCYLQCSRRRIGHQVCPTSTRNRSREAKTSTPNSRNSESTLLSVRHSRLRSARYRRSFHGYFTARTRNTSLRHCR